MKSFWNERFSHDNYVYGTEPNEYLKEKLATLHPGTILFPAEGEGRNAVHAAVTGWKTTAFDQSTEGRKKAMALAEKKEVDIAYDISTFEDAAYQPASFDAAAMIFAHLPSSMRRQMHRKVSNYIKPGGFLILEGFSKKHVEYQKIYPNVGGPRDVDMLYDKDELMEDFKGFDFHQAAEMEIELSEGDSHQGKASVVRILAQKQN